MGPSAIRYAGLAEHLAEKLGIVTDDLGNVEAPVAESLARRRRAGALPAADPRAVRPRGEARRAGDAAQAKTAARARRRPLGRARLARRHGGGARPGRRRLGRRARRPEHAGDVAERQRARDGARGGARARPATRSHYDDWTLPAIESGKLALVGVRSLDDGRARAAEAARREGVHDERDRQASASSRACARRSSTRAAARSCT